MVNLIQKFRKSEDGTASIEAVLWTAFMMFLVTFVVDVALIFYGQARALEVAQDANRAYSIGSLETEDEVKTYIKNRLAPISPRAQSTVGREDGLITTIITIPTGDLDAVGMFTSLSQIDMRVVAQMVQER